jgi:hypothetical protein
MPEWQFPNAIALGARAMADRRGQTRDRDVRAEADWTLPSALVVRVGDACGMSPMNVHTSFRNATWCDSCGALIAVG